MPARGELGGGAADLLRVQGIDPAAWDNRIRITVSDAIRKSLGELSTAQFYNPEARQKRVDSAREEINQLLNPIGIAVDAVLLRRAIYEDGIENAIFQKNLQELERELAQKQGEFAKAEAEVRQAAAQGDAAVRTLQVEGDTKVMVLRSEGDLYQREKEALADLEVAKAIAEVDRLKAAAFAKGAGSDVYVARELAPLLASLRGGIVGDLNPYDIAAWMAKLGVKDLTGRQDQTSNPAGGNAAGSASGLRERSSDTSAGGN
jgi:regulator of protease activity HflC (stomatin/prohibitin superfamily)